MEFRRVLFRSSCARSFDSLSSSPSPSAIRIHAAPMRGRPATSWPGARRAARSEEHTSELQSLMRISYAVFCLKKKKKKPNNKTKTTHDTSSCQTQHIHNKSSVNGPYYRHKHTI